MLVKVAEAEGPILDYLVARAAGGLAIIYRGKGATRFPGTRINGKDYVLACKATTEECNRCEGSPFYASTEFWQPSYLPGQAHKIIHDEKIDTAWSGEGWYANMYWRGADITPGYPAGQTFRCGGDGETPLIAAMRCYVISRLGVEVEVPDGHF